MQVPGEEIDGLGVQEVARQLGVHEQTLRRWIWRGKVKATRSQVGRSYRWLVSADADAPVADEQSSRERALEAAFGPAADPDDSVASTPPAREAVAQRERLSVIEEQIEREIRHLNAQAVTLQSEIDRLNRTLSVLRSDSDA
jgi:excisionase family DNA binding protein